MRQVTRGNAVTITGTFTLSGVATDPTTITLEVKIPAGTITPYTYAGAQITRDSAGVYHKDVILSSEGVWTFRMTGTGTVVASTVTNVECKSDVFV